MTPRRLCPACVRRYAALVAHDCPVCQGIGVLNLGAAALAHYDPAPIARAVELYLETHARRDRNELPLDQHRPRLEAAVDELRLAGVLASPHDTTTTTRADTPTNPTTARITELDAYRVARHLGTPVTTPTLAALAAPPVDNLAQVRPRDGRPPTGSANGHRSALATTADPIDPLGDDTATIHTTRHADRHRANVIAAAIPATLARRNPTP